MHELGKGKAFTMSEQFSSASGPAPAPPPTHQGLRQSCLSYSEVLAQSVSVIAPSTVPAAVLGLVFAMAGNATWLSFVLGTLGLVLVSLNINQFARRSASPGSLYSYVVRGLGPTAGVMAGWALLFGYTLTGMSTLCGFALIANVLLQHFLGLQLPIVVLFGIGAALAFIIAFRDIQLSAKTMLVLEAAALLFVLMLGGIIWSRAGFSVDAAQLSLKGATPGGTLGAVVLVIFAFSGFESSTALGDEAKRPLVTIPRSVLQSVLFSGAFFISMAYVVVLGFAGADKSLAESEAPLHTLANASGWSGLGTLIDVGILLSFFSCTLAAINSTARILYSMAQHGLVAGELGHAHAQNRTPHVAVGIATLLTFAVPAAAYAAGSSAFEAQGHFGTLCSFGFIAVYMLISAAAPAYLASIGKLTWRARAYSVGALGFMLLPLLGTIGIPGSELFPMPDQAGATLIAIFIAYMAIGLGWLLFQRVRRPRMLAHMQDAIESVHAKFATLTPDPIVVPSAERQSRI
jgi:amino acid transporter